HYDPLFVLTFATLPLFCMVLHHGVKFGVPSSIKSIIYQLFLAEKYRFEADNGGHPLINSGFAATLWFLIVIPFKLLKSITVGHSALATDSHPVRFRKPNPLLPTLSLQNRSFNV